MKVFSHRGNCREALENSWRAFQLSLETGVKGIEMDVHLTKDKHWVIHHDSNIKRMTGIDRYLHDMTRKELASIKQRDGSVIPFLDEFLAKYTPQLEINIEIKDYSKKAAEHFASFYQSCKHKEKLLVSAGNLNTVIYLSRLAPKMRLGLVFELPKFICLKPIVSLIVANICKKVKLEAIHPIIYLCHPKYARIFRQHNLQINGWFPLAGEQEIPNPDWQNALDAKIEGLISNDPRALIKWLNEQ